MLIGVPSIVRLRRFCDSPVISPERLKATLFRSFRGGRPRWGRLSRRGCLAVTRAS